MRIDIITIFPRMLDGFIGESMMKRAVQQGAVEFRKIDLRDFTDDKHRTTDDRPFGGGPGMIIMPEPVFAAVEAVQSQTSEPGQLILLTPAGERLTQPLVQELAKRKRLLLLCGRYEGFDERIRQGLRPREISIGDFVCNGGEVPAMVVIETVIRYVPGVLGDADSVKEESHSEAGRLEYPQYTRPREFRGLAVPDVLLSGDHQAIARWRREQSEARSRRHVHTMTEIPRGEREGDHEEQVPKAGRRQADGGPRDVQADHDG